MVDETDEVVSAGQAAEMVGVSRQSVVNAVAAGKLRGERDSEGGWRIPVAQLANWQPKRSAAGTAQTPTDVPLTATRQTELERELERVRAQRDALKEVVALLTDAMQ